MAKVRLNRALQAVSGTLDGYCFKKFKNGLTTLSRKPTFTHEWSAQQVAGRDRWKLAAEYATAVWADPKRRAFYEKLARQRKAWRAYNLATGDFMNPPEIQKIMPRDYRGKSGHVMSILASDDIGVTSVEVRLRDKATRRVLEEGVAAEMGKSVFEYTTTTTIRVGTDLEIEVIAEDRPGNRTSRVESIR